MVQAHKRFEPPPQARMLSPEALERGSSAARQPGPGGAVFCPCCGAEYREGPTRCADCDVDLVVALLEPETSAAAERIVVLCTYASEFEAHVAMTALDAVGIAASVRVDDAGGLNPALAFSRGAELLVRAEDLAAAHDALAVDG